MGHYSEQEQSVLDTINKENYTRITNIVEYMNLIKDEVEYFRKYGNDLGRIAFDQFTAAHTLYSEVQHQIGDRIVEK